MCVALAGCLDPGEAPKCRCGVQATPATVGKDTPNKGRRYFHCPTRECGFFAWADGGEVTFRRGGSAAKLSWARLPLELHVVCDSGARAARHLACGKVTRMEVGSLVGAPPRWGGCLPTRPPM